MDTGDDSALGETGDGGDKIASPLPAAGAEESDPLRGCRGSGLFGKSADLLKENPISDQSIDEQESHDSEIVFNCEGSSILHVTQSSTSILVNISGNGSSLDPPTIGQLQNGSSGEGSHMTEGLSLSLNGSATDQRDSVVEQETMQLSSSDMRGDNEEEVSEDGDDHLVMEHEQKEENAEIGENHEMNDGAGELEETTKEDEDENVEKGDKTTGASSPQAESDKVADDEMSVDPVADSSANDEVEDTEENPEMKDDAVNDTFATPSSKKASPKRKRGRGRASVSQTKSPSSSTATPSPRVPRRSRVQDSATVAVDVDSPRVLRTRSAAVVASSPASGSSKSATPASGGKKRSSVAAKMDDSQESKSEEIDDLETSAEALGNETNETPSEHPEEESAEDHVDDSSSPARQLRSPRGGTRAATRGGRTSTAPTTPEVPTPSPHVVMSEGRAMRGGRRGRGGRGGRTSDRGDRVVNLDEMNLDSPGGASAGGRGGRRSAVKAKAAGEDPFSLDNMDVHPEPLRNIQVDRGSFGNVRFTKTASANTSASSSLNRYANTEKAASERLSSMPTSPMKKVPVSERSISELSPLLRKEISGRKRARRSNATGLFSDVEDHVDDDNATDEEEEEDETRTGDETMDTGTEGEFDSSISEVKRRGRPSLAEHATTATPSRGRGGARRSVTSQSSARGERQSKQRYSDADISISSRRSTHTSVDVPQLSADEQLHVDHPTHPHAALLPGARVFALWDKIFYPANVISRDGLGRYKVRFVEDRRTRDVPPPGIIPLNSLVTGKEASISDASDGDFLLETVEIRKAPSAENAQEWKEGVYEIANPEKQQKRRVVWTKLLIDADQSKSLLLTRVNTAAEVVADNINEAESRSSRRTRTSLVPSEASPGAAPNEDGSRRSGNAKTPAGTSAGRPKKTSTTPRGSGTKRGAAAAVDEPSPKKRAAGHHHQFAQFDDRLFDELRFVLTSANRRVKDAEEVVPFNKREIRQMIEARGGQVVDDLSQLESADKVYLIADTHYRTHKYLSALARGVPCVSHAWIIECVKQETLVPHEPFMLPAGISLQSEELVPWHANNTHLLVGRRVLVHTQNVQPSHVQTFVQIWSPLVAYMGAEILDDVPDDAEGRLDILLTDTSCNSEVLTRARALGAIVVSSEWLIQAIILGECPDENGHERYRYDYVEPAFEPMH